MTMLIELFEALMEAMQFRDINPETISRIDSNVGFIWFKADGQSYSLNIQKVEFDLDQHPSEP